MWSDQAFLLGTAKSRTRTALAAGGYRRTQVDTTFDGYGMPAAVSDLADVAVATDDLCAEGGTLSHVSRTYARRWGLR